MFGLTPSGLVARTGRGSLFRTFSEAVVLMLLFVSPVLTDRGLFVPVGFVLLLTPVSGLTSRTGLTLFPLTEEFPVLTDLTGSKR